MKQGLPDDPFGDLAGAGLVVFGIAAVLVVLWARGAWRARRTVQGAMTAHVGAHGDEKPSWLQRLIGRHEMGHVVGAEREGMGVERVQIGKGWGRVTARRFVSVDASITFLAAGHKAIGSKRGADGDLAAIDALKKLIPRDERRARVAAALNRADRWTSAEQGRICRDGDRLAREGRYWR